MKYYRTVMSIIFSLILSQSVLSQQLVSVSATQLQPRSQAGYVFVIQTTQPLSPNSGFVIVFPQAFMLQNVKMGATKAFRGGVTVEVRGDTAIVRRTGLGDTAPAGDIDIFLASVINPPDMEQEFDFKITRLDGELPGTVVDTRIAIRQAQSR